jgi:preprotein translocase subunit SecD
VHLVTLALGLGMTAAADEKKGVKLEIRAAEKEAAEGLTEATVEGTKQKIYLHKKAAITNEDIADARAALDGDGNPKVDVTFTKEGAKKMQKLTEQQKEKLIAILVDGKVISAPVVNSVVSEKAQITGKFTRDEVEKLAKALKPK